jgi:hypothetical protein
MEGTLGGAAFDGAMAVALDIQLPLEGVDAIISPSVFSGRLIRFDFAASAARILPRNTNSIPHQPAQPYVGENAHGMLRRTPGVIIQFPNGQPIEAILDTGAARGLSLPLAMAESIPLTGPLVPDEPVRMIGVPSRPSFKGIVAGAVRVGPIVLQNPEVRFEDGSTEIAVGMPVLRQGIIVLDPQAQRSWFLAP